MGGTAVAAGNWHSAQYYNAALLAFHDEHEEDSRDGRVALPNIVAQTDNAVEDIVNAADDELDQQLTNDINAFNGDPSAENAGAVAETSRQLESLLGDLVNENLSTEAFAGFSITEPSMLEGGAFYFGVRALTFGDSNVPQADIDLLESYVSALETVAGGGDLSAIPPELLDVDGNLIDPTLQLNSSADLSALTISEWAVAMAKQIDFFGQELAFGLTPKVMRVDVFRETTEFQGEDINFEDSQKTYINLNADVGLAFQLFDNYRIGLAVKDVVPEKFTTANGLELQLKPRPRMGLAYVNEWLTVGMDVDLAENEPIANEGPTQDASFGLEVSPFRSLNLRLGYRQDMTGVREDVLAGGVAYQFKRIYFELSYARSDLSTGAGLQFGWTF